MRISEHEGVVVVFNKRDIELLSSFIKAIQVKDVNREMSDDNINEVSLMLYRICDSL